MTGVEGMGCPGKPWLALSRGRSKPKSALKSEEAAKSAMHAVVDPFM